MGLRYFLPPISSLSLESATGVFSATDGACCVFLGMTQSISNFFYGFSPSLSSCFPPIIAISLLISWLESRILNLETALESILSKIYQRHWLTRNVAICLSGLYYRTFSDWHCRIKKCGTTSTRSSRSTGWPSTFLSSRSQGCLILHFHWKDCGTCVSVSKLKKIDHI